MPETAHGLIIVYTGDGKGKTTAALGTIFRAWGRRMVPCVIQFLKAETGQWGEVKAAKKLGIEWHSLGDGFTWKSKDLDESAEKARQAWALAQEKIASDAYDLILLDEFTYPLQFGWLDIPAVLAWLKAHKPPRLHLIITGRNAPVALLEIADLVTEMSQVRHPYEKGVKAQPGIEY
jgi:cob(I)alamin adenosyltransferase